MSKYKKLNELTPEEQKILKKQGVVTPRATDWVPYPESINLYEIRNGYVYYPFSLKINGIKKSTSQYEPNEFNSTLKLFNGENDPSGLKRDQTVVFREAMYKLKKDQCAFLNLSTGFGKTALCIHLTSKVKRGKRLVLVYNASVQKGWLKSYKQFSDAKVQHLVGNKKKDENAHVYVMGLMKASKMDPSFFDDISMLVIDEVDQLPAKSLLKMMKLVAPVYLIGQSATINRDDNMHQALYSYFGPRNTFIKRFIVKDFDVIKLQTRFVPQIEYGDNGMVDNNVLTNSIAYNEERQELIATLAKEYANDKILILSNRIEEIEGIYEKLKDEDADYKTTTKPKWDTSKRVLVAGFKSCGRGLDIPGLSILILTTSVNKVEQNEGRIRMNENLIIDIVDNHSIFEKRWENRKRWYKKRGATLFWRNDTDTKTVKMEK